MRALVIGMTILMAMAGWAAPKAEAGHWWKRAYYGPKYYVYPGGWGRKNTVMVEDYKYWGGPYLEEQLHGYNPYGQ